MSPVELLGFLAGGIGMFYGLPQARSIRAAGHGEGVSLAGWVLMFAVSASWASYGVSIGAPSVIITNTIAGLVNASVVIALVGHERRPLLWLPAFAAGVLVFVLVMPAAVVSALLISLVFAQAPQILESYRSVREGRATVVSLNAMLVSILSLLCWGGYALLSDRPLMILTTALALAVSLSITALELLARREQAATAARVCV